MLTKDELDLTKLLGDCWNKWVDLPGHHPMDKQEFASGIHRLQDMVGMRSAARCHPEDFPFVLGGPDASNTHG